MEGRKISFVVLAMAGLLTACGSRVWGDDSEISTALAFGEAEECTQNAKTREDTIVKISDCLSEQVPEIDDWAAYVDLKSDGQAYLYQTFQMVITDRQLGYGLVIQVLWIMDLHRIWQIS